MSLSTLQAMNYILPLITLPYLVRVLGPDRFGIIMFAQSFMMYFNIVVDYGFNLSATRQIAIHRDDSEKITEIFSAVMMIKTILLILSFALLSAIIFGVERFRSDWALYYLTFALVIGQAIFPVWYFQGMEKMKFITGLNIVAKLFFTLMIFVVVRGRDDYIYVPLLNGIGFIIAGLVSLWIIKIKFKQRFVLCRYGTLKQHFTDSTDFFWSRVSVSAYTSSNIFILGMTSSPAVVGYYAIAEKIYIALQQVYQPIVQTLNPYIAKQKKIALFKKIFVSATALNLLTVAVLLLMSEKVIYVVSGQHLPASNQVLRILLVSSLAVVPSIMLGYPFLAALGHKGYANYSVISGSLLHIGVLIILALFGTITLYKIALLVLATELLVLSIRVYAVKKLGLWSQT